MIRVMARWGVGPNMVRGTKQPEPERQGIREARGEKEGKREFDRCERQRAEDAAAPSSCPRRTNLERFPNVRFGSGSADPGIFGYFPSLESTSPGGEISPVLFRKSGPRDGQKTNLQSSALRPYVPRAATWGGPYKGSGKGTAPPLPSFTKKGRNYFRPLKKVLT